MSRNYKRKRIPLITFTNANFQGVDPKWNDLVVITMEIKNFPIEKILVDQGS